MRATLCTPNMHLCGVLSPDEYAAPVRDCTIRPAEHTTPEMCSRCRPVEIAIIHRGRFWQLIDQIPGQQPLLLIGNTYMWCFNNSLGK